MQILQTSELSFEKLKRFHMQLLSTHVIFLGYNSGMCFHVYRKHLWRALKKKKDLNTLKTAMSPEEALLWSQTFPT